MRILFVTRGMQGGGTEKLLADLLPLLHADSHVEVELFLLFDKGEKYLAGLKKAGVRVYVANRKSHCGRMRALYRVIQKGQYDIVHANLFPVIYYCSFLKKARGRRFPKLLMTEHNTDNRRRHHRSMRPLEQWVYASYDRVVCISDATKGSLMEWLSAENPRKFPIIYNGIDLSRYQKAGKYRRGVLFPGIQAQDILLCMAGTFTEKKNHAFLIEAMRRLPESYKLLLLGEGRLKEKIKADAGKAGLKGRIRFLGFRTDADFILKSSDIVVVPSKWEGFGLIAAEAMACSKAVVCSDIPGLREVVGDAGVKVEPENADALAAALLRLKDKNERERYGRMARQRAALFSLDNVKKQYMGVYTECLGEEADQEWGQRSNR